VRRSGADTSVIDEVPKCLGDHDVEQPFPGQGHEEARIHRVWLEVIAQPRVVVERCHAAGV